jgi:ATP/maltotriose-dependent transcriptional regulator MalT
VSVLRRCGSDLCCRRQTTSPEAIRQSRPGFWSRAEAATSSATQLAQLTGLSTSAVAGDDHERSPSRPYSTEDRRGSPERRPVVVSTCAITKRLIEQFARTAPPAPNADLAELTPRELEVLLLIARGLANAEIAAELFVTEATVKTHVTRILTKLHLRDRVQAVVLAYETGLVTSRSD